MPPAASSVLTVIMSGEYEKALALLHNDSSPGSMHGRVFALTRLGHYDRAILAADTANVGSVTAEEFAALSLLRIFILARIGKLEDAAASMDRLLSTLNVKNPVIDLECHYVAAYLSYCRRDYDSVIARLKEIIAATELIHADFRPPYLPHDAFCVRAKAATLLGVIAGMRDDYSESERWHCEALLSAERARPRDVYLEGLILANLSCVISEVYAPSAVALLENRVASLKWTPSMSEQLLYVERHLRISRNLYGLGGPLSKSAKVSSPSIAWRLAEFVDKLLTAQWPSEDAYLKELQFAKSLVQRVDWLGTFGEEGSNLNDLVILLAAFDLPAAEMVQRNFEEKIVTFTSHFPTGRTARDKAWIDVASGCLAKGNGTVGRGLPKLSKRY